MKTTNQDHGQARVCKTLATIDFDGHHVTAVRWRDGWWWPAAQVGEAIGYAHGRKLVENIRGEWSADFVDGRDHCALAGADLAEFRAAANDYTESVKSLPRGRGGARSLVVLSESGIDLALVMSKTDKGRKLRRLLVDTVLPQLRATGAATLVGGAPAIDGPAVLSIVRDMMKEAASSLRAEILAELKPTLFAGVDFAPFLARRARSLVLGPLLTLARIYGQADGPRRVAQERGRLDRRLRDHVGWHEPWAFYPVHDLGRVSAWLEAEIVTANRVATELARARQLTLAPRPQPPPRGQA